MKGSEVNFWFDYDLSSWNMTAQLANKWHSQIKRIDYFFPNIWKLIALIDDGVFCWFEDIQNSTHFTGNSILINIIFSEHLNLSSYDSKRLLWKHHVVVWHFSFPSSMPPHNLLNIKQQATRRLKSARRKEIWKWVWCHPMPFRDEKKSQCVIFHLK